MNTCKVTNLIFNAFFFLIKTYKKRAIKIDGIFDFHTLSCARSHAACVPWIEHAWYSGIGILTKNSHEHLFHKQEKMYFRFENLRLKLQGCFRISLWFSAVKPRITIWFLTSAYKIGWFILQDSRMGSNIIIALLFYSISCSVQLQVANIWFGVITLNSNMKRILSYHQEILRNIYD